VPVKLSETEVALLANQLTFEEVFEDLTKQQFIKDQIDARIERDEEVVKYFLVKQTDSIGAQKIVVDNVIQYDIIYNGYEISAKPGASSDKTEHKALLAVIE
jgi:hypothetical protein